MSLIEWNKEKFSVHVDEMDEQHKKWIALINTLHDSLIENNCNISANDALQGMLDYTKYHFAKEEELMTNAGYPNYDAHLLAHADFISKLATLDRAIQSGEILLRTQIMSVLKSWLEDHIQKTDRLYGKFFTLQSKS